MNRDRPTYARLLALPLFFYAALSACSHTPPPLSWEVPADLTARPSASSQSSYLSALEAWTREGARFEDFEGRLFVKATCLSPALEQLRAEFEADRLMLSPQERLERVQISVKRAERHARFLVAIVTQEEVHNDLRLRGGALSATLSSDGGEITEATSITELTLKERLSAQFAFPYLSSLHHAYWVSFPKSERAGQLTLRISGLPASLSLTWHLTPPQNISTP